MKRIDKDELYRTLRGFLKSKGIALEDGTYTMRIRQGCNLLTDAINTTQKTVARAKVQVDQKLDQFRHSVHQVTAPKPPLAPTGSGQPGEAKGKTRRRAKPSATGRRARRK